MPRKRGVSVALSSTSGAPAGRPEPDVDNRDADGAETLAEAIKAISKGLRRLESSGLNRRAITVLVAHHSKVSHRNIEKVLDSLDKLAATYTR